MKISIEKVRNRLESSLIRKGLNQRDAQIVADDYLAGELQGKTSHGLMAFPSLLKNFKRPTKKPLVLVKTHSLLVIEAYEELGAIVARDATDILFTMAAKEGIAAAFIKNMMTWLRPGSIAEYIANHKMIGITFNNGGKPMVAPPGGYDPLIGTNPMGIGIPTVDSPIVVDMATSKRAWGEVRKAKRFGTELPEQTYFDASGNFTLNPDKARSVIAAGDYKGFALGLLIEILTGSLLGRHMGKDLDVGEYRTLTRGGVILVINPAIFRNMNAFQKENSKIVHDIKTSAKRKGVKEIFLPGEHAQHMQRQNIQNGYIEIEDSLWKALMA